MWILLTKFAMHATIPLVARAGLLIIVKQRRVRTEHVNREHSVPKHATLEVSKTSHMQPHYVVPWACNLAGSGDAGGHVQSLLACYRQG